MSDRPRDRGWVPAVLALCAALVLVSGQVVPVLRGVAVVVWATAALLLVAALVAATRRVSRRRRLGPLDPTSSAHSTPPRPRRTRGR